MPRPRMDNKPSVATYSDHEIISPPHKLRQAMSEVAVPASDDDPVARAERALARLSSEFSTWMEEEGERLDQARNAVKAAGFTGATRDALFFAAHDIRGDAETLGYPGLTIPAESLCRLIEHTRDMRRIPIALVDQHVDAVRAIIREGSRPDAEQTVADLTQKLRGVTDEFLARENRDRLDELKDILSPSLAPGDRTT
jgi:HPt (histidine-containing phosphotransfer) domain-containing protein